MAVSTSTLLLVLRARNDTGAAFASATHGLIGLGAAAAGVGVAAGAISSLKLAGNFQASMLQTAALTGQTAAAVGASTEQMSQGFTGVSSAVLQMATQMPVSAQNLAQGLYYITSSGYNTADAMKILTLSGKDATIGHMDAKVAADALTTALHSYGAGADQAANYNDVLLQSINLGKAEFSDLASSIGGVLPVAKLMGASFGDVGASLAVMTLNGMSARQATMDMRAFLQQMSVGTKGSNMERIQLGLDFSAAHIEKVGIPGIVDEIKKATAGPDQMAEITKLFPNKAARGAIIPLIQHSGELSKDASLMPKQGDNSGAITTAAFATSMQGANEQLKLLNTTIGSVQTALGGMFLPTVVRVAQAIGGGILTGLRLLSAGIQMIEHPAQAWRQVMDGIGATVQRLLPFLLAGVGILVAWRAATMAHAAVMAGVVAVQKAWSAAQAVWNGVVAVGKGIQAAWTFAVAAGGAVMATVRTATMLYAAANNTLALAVLAVRLGLVQQALQTALTTVATTVAREASLLWVGAQLLFIGVVGAVRTALAGQTIVTIAASVASAVARQASLLWTGAQLLWMAAVSAGRATLLAFAVTTSGFSLAATGARIAGAAWTGVQWLLNAAFAANPLGAVILLVAGLTAGFIWAFNNVKPFHALIVTLWSTLTNTLGPAIKTVGGWIKTILGDAFSFVTTQIGNFLTMLQGMLETMTKIPGVANLVNPVLKSIASAQKIIAEGPATVAKTVTGSLGAKPGKVGSLPDAGGGGTPPWLSNITNLLTGGMGTGGAGATDKPDAASTAVSASQALLAQSQAPTAALVSAINKLTPAQILHLKGTAGQGSGSEASDIISALRAQFTSDKAMGASKGTLQLDVTNLVNAEKEFKLGNPLHDAAMLTAQINHTAAVKTAKDATTTLNDQLKVLSAQYKASGDPNALAKFRTLDLQKYTKSGIDAGLAAQLVQMDASNLTKPTAAASPLTQARQTFATDRLTGASSRTLTTDMNRILADMKATGATHAAILLEQAKDVKAINAATTKTATRSPVLSSALSNFGGGSASGVASQGQSVISFSGARAASDREQMRQLQQQLAALQQQLVLEKGKNSTLLAQMAALLAQIVGHGARTAQATEQTADAANKPNQSIAALLRPHGVALVGR